ncbi:MAG TPA: MMPL family transporter [Clostridia bacterium]|jgi:predicted RND superfamily exporter protein|nr:MMPL family transporter [Clostridia bacterium]HOL61267.1 MMPL family transporter [Clostridia bacterium]HPO53668.1 MMPL family transporter [Clostridia bacterium]
MEKIIRFIVEKKLLICIIFCVLIAASAACIPFVRVNYDDTSYLPKNSETKQALEYLYDQYGSGGNASIMFDDVDIEGALEYKERLEKIDGIKKVLWLDDVLAGFLDDVVAQMNEEGTAITKAEAIEYLLGTIGVIKLDNRGVNYPRFIGVLLTKFMEGGLSMGLMGEFKPQLEGFYRQDAAFMQIFFTEGDYADATYKAINEIRKMGVSLYMTGNAAVNYNSRKMVSNETMISTIIASSVVLIILFLMTKSYWEPVIYLMTIGSAVIINMGTNIFMGGISYMTQGVASVLQLALTMDYSIFLLNRYRREKKSGLDNNEAMISAIKHSLSPISASSLTTIASFVALMFMSYRLGLDIGLVLTKGVVISMLSVFMFMPALILYTDKLITKSAHKSFRFTFKKLSAGLVKSRYVLPFIIIAIMAPCAYFQSQNLFVYGNEATMGSEGSLIAADREAVEGIFGTQNQMLIILPDGANAKEYDISMKLLELEYMGISSVQSLSLVREAGLEDVLPPVLKNQFIGKSSTRIILSLSIPSEGEQTEKLVDTIRGILDEELKDTEVSGGDKYYLVGEASATMEIKSLVERDYDIITYVSLALVGLVILVSFKSAIIPVILLLVIQGSVYINMTIPYLTKEPIIFVGYLLVSSILLGATIDYAILFTDNYMSNRQTMNKFDSARFAMSQSARALITSAGILTFSGLTLWVISGMPASSLFGAAIFRGGLLAFICVMILLPQLLMLLDTPIRYSTWKGKEKMIRSRDATPMDTRNITDEQ